MDTKKYDTVVVIGASIGGLLAAAAAAPFADRVVVLDRDRLPEEPGPRPSTPQAVHSHGLLGGGRVAIEELLPGFTDRVADQGGWSGRDMGTSVRWYVGGGLLADCEMGVTGLAASRLALEHTVRTGVRELPAVEILDGVDVVRLHGDALRVTGVVARSRDDGHEWDIDADLVVDCSGRAGRAARWLPELGAAVAPEERIGVGLRYATVHVKAEDDDVDGRIAVVNTTTPQRPRGGVALRQEDNTWTITLFGYGEDAPPLDVDGYRDRAAELEAPEIATLVAREFLHDATTYRYPDARRRRFERIRLPEGYAPLGDAICSFDPAFGQGMSVAAQEALALRALLGEGLAAVRRSYPRRAAAIVDGAWIPMQGEVLQLPETVGEPPRGHAAVARYVNRLKRVARHDPAVARAFYRVLNLLEPPHSLFAPGVAWRVLRGWR